MPGGGNPIAFPPDPMRRAIGIIIAVITSGSEVKGSDVLVDIPRRREDCAGNIADALKNRVCTPGGFGAEVFPFVQRHRSAPSPTERGEDT